MNKRNLLLSLLILPVHLLALFSGEGGLVFPLLWLTALLLSPLFTAPLVAGERAGGTDLLLFTGPYTDEELLFRLFRKGASSFLSFMLIPSLTACLILLGFSVDGGRILLSLLTMGVGVLIFTGIGLALSAFTSRIVTAWLLSYAVLLPLNFLPFAFPRWTDPLFSGYLPLAVPFLAGLVLVLSGGLFLARLAHLREERERKAKTRPILLLLPLMAAFFFFPGGTDLTFSGQMRLNRVTAKQIRSLEDPVYIRWYRTSNYRSYNSAMDGVEAFLFSLRFKSGSHIRYERPRLSDEEIILMGEEKGWTVQSVAQGGNYEPFYSVLEVEYHGLTETLTLLYNPIIGEEQLLAALQRHEAAALPRAGILIGRADRADGEFWSVLQGALAEYFDVVDYTGRADALEAEQPDCLFVLGGTDLSDWEVSRILSYGEEGGSVLLTLSSYILDPVQTDRIEPSPETPLLRDLGRLGIFPGDSFIVDPNRGLYLPSGEETPPDFYPLWFSTGDKSLYDYQALWSVPLHYTGEEEILWQVDSSPTSFLATGLSDITPASLYQTGQGGEASYTTCLALPLGEGILTVLSGEEALSNLMALADEQLSNSAWIQTVAFFLSGNEELLELRQKSLGRRS
ncbi:MAG: Gldg family protein [Spirochaetales bacterium]|nr:Gldg family protein [Spirochaetales bacterium]